MRSLCSISAATAPNLFWRLHTVYWFSAHLLSAATIDGVPLLLDEPKKVAEMV
jgi:hypothetical protein